MLRFIIEYIINVSVIWLLERFTDWISFPGTGKSLFVVGLVVTIAFFIISGFFRRIPLLEISLQSIALYFLEKAPLLELEIKNTVILILITVIMFGARGLLLWLLFLLLVGIAELRHRGYAEYIEMQKLLGKQMDIGDIAKDIISDNPFNPFS